jgi:hypothetical protein
MLTTRLGNAGHKSYMYEKPLMMGNIKLRFCMGTGAARRRSRHTSAITRIIKTLTTVITITTIITIITIITITIMLTLTITITIAITIIIIA